MKFQRAKRSSSTPVNGCGTARRDPRERNTSRSVFRPFHCKPCTATRNSFLPAESKEAGHKKDSNHREGQRDFDGGAEDEADSGGESGARRLAGTSVGQ